MSSAANDQVEDPRWEQAIRCFDSGDGIGALRLWEGLAADGDPCAYVELGNLHELGKVTQAPDYEEAAKWYRKAVFEINDSKAHLALARMYLNGQLSSDNPSEAFLRHAYAAYQQQEPLAALFLGVAFQYGRLAPKNDTHVEAYLEYAAASGSVLAQALLARRALLSGHYRKGLGLLLRAIQNRINYSSHDPRLAGTGLHERHRKP